MPTRFYFPVNGSLAPVSPAVSPSWNIVQATPVRRLGGKVKSNTAMLTDSTPATDTVAAVSNAIFAQYVSPALAAQTISGTIRGVVRMLESNAAANAFMQLIVRVVSNDGSVVRGTLYGGSALTTVVATVGAINEELGTSAATRLLPAQTMTSVAVQDGDRLVYEIGVRFTNTVTTSYTAGWSRGDPSAADLAFTSGVTANTDAPWIEFSGDVFYQGEGTPVVKSGSATVTTTHTTSAVGRRVTRGTASVVTTHTTSAVGRKVTRGTASVTTTHTTSAVGVRPTTPGEVLNIGPGPTQNHFDVQISPTTGAWYTKTQAEIAAGFTEPAHFYVSGNKVVFRPRADGSTTSGTSFARDELREVNADGSQMKFDALTGEHSLETKFTINYAPANDPDVVVMQLHDGDSDRLAIRTQMFSNGTVVLGVRINGTLHATRFVTATSYALAQGTVFGVEHRVKLRVANGTAEIYYNDMVTPLITSTALVQTTHPDGWYWKTGAYNQFNPTSTGAAGGAITAAEYSEVMLRDIAVAHTAPVLPIPSGSATVTTTHATTAAGRRITRGTATVATTHTTSAAGRRITRGTATVTTTHATTAAGRRVTRGTATIVTTHTTTAAGVRPGLAIPAGSATVVTTHTTSASGTRVSRGTATTVTTHSTTAVGRRITRGTATVTTTHTTTAAGRKVALGTATVTTTHVASAAGRKVARGTAVAVTTHTATAAGARVSRGSAATVTTHTTTAAGRKVQSGQATVTTSHTTTAAGTTVRRGTATVVTTHTATAAGFSPQVGVRQGSARVTTAHTTSAVGYRAARGTASVITTHTATAAGVRPGVPGKSGSATTSTTHTTSAVGRRTTRGTATVTTTHGTMAMGRVLKQGSAVTTTTHVTRADGLGLYRGTASVSTSHTTHAVGETPGKGVNIDGTAQFGPDRYTSAIHARTGHSAEFGPSRYDSTTKARSLTAEFTNKKPEARFA